MLLEHIFVHIALRGVYGIKNYTLSALLLDVKISICRNIVSVSYLAGNNYRVELAHSLVAYVIVIGL